jgi:hypothetical protein
MNLTDKRVAEEFARFEKEQDATPAYRALEAVETAVRGLPAGDATAVQRAMSYWLHFFGALDRAIDPQWDVRGAPVCVVAPPTTHRMVYPSGDVDPLSIPDPVARAQYEQALKASEDYRKWYSAQFQLRRIEERAMRSVGLLLAARYAGSEEYKQELEGFLAGSPVGDLRKERIRALMPKPG